MFYVYALLYCSVTLFSIQNVTSKNHLKGKVFKDAYKIKRLVHFKNSLCMKIDDLINEKYESQLLR